MTTSPASFNAYAKKIITAHSERFLDALGMLYHSTSVKSSLRSLSLVTAYNMHDESITQDWINTFRDDAWL